MLSPGLFLSIRNNDKSTYQRLHWMIAVSQKVYEKERRDIKGTTYSKVLFLILSVKMFALRCSCCTCCTWQLCGTSGSTNNGDVC